MIRIITFRTVLGDKHGDTVANAIREHVARMVLVEKKIRGIKVVHDGRTLDISLRMSGSDRWRIARDARKIGSFLLASQRLPITRPLHPIAEVTEENARSRTLAQGRTPQLVVRQHGPAETTRWGDELPQ